MHYSDMLSKYCKFYMGVANFREKDADDITKYPNMKHLYLNLIPKFKK